MARPKFLRLSVLAPALRGETRVFVFSAIGAVAGLGIALAGLFEPAPAPAPIVPAGYVALVNQRPILMDDFINQTQATTSMAFADATPEQRRKVLHAMVDEELMVQRALTLDLPEQDTDVREALVVGVQQAIAAPVLAQTISDAQLLAYFNAHRSSYAAEGILTYRDIVLHVGGIQDADQTVAQAAADAEEAVYQLRSGSSLDYVKEHFGFVDSEHHGDADPDFAAKLHLGPKLYPVAAKLMTGEISDPVVDKDGVHIILMGQHIPPRFADFAASRSRVYDDFRRDAQQRADEQNLKLLRSNAQILLAPGQQE
jgi:parvulin-like peptidyl-prolyl isomerase